MCNIIYFIIFCMSEKNKPNSAEIMKSRTLSDAEILKAGGEYDEKGGLQVPKDFVLPIDIGWSEDEKLKHKKMGHSEPMTSKEAVEVMASTLEKIKNLLKKINGEECVVEKDEDFDEYSIYSKNRKGRIKVDVEGSLSSRGKLTLPRARVIIMDEHNRYNQYDDVILFGDGDSNEEEAKLKLVAYRLSRHH